MSGLAGLALGKSILGGGIGIARAVVAWLGRRSLTEIALIAVVVASLLIHFSDLHRLHRTEKQLLATSNALGKERLAHKADIARWKAASEAATAKNKAQILQVTTEQAKISEESSHDYATQLADLRARLDRMRAGSSSVNQRPANGNRTPSVPNGPRAAPSEALPSTQPDLQYTAETELQLNALIDWVRRQSAIDPNAH